MCPIPRINIEISNQSGESPSTVSSAATHFKKLDSFFVLEAVSDTEIKWTLQHFFFSNLSFRSSYDVSAFMIMFPESCIAQKFCLEKDKSSSQ